MEKNTKEKASNIIQRTIRNIKENFERTEKARERENLKSILERVERGGLAA